MTTNPIYDLVGQWPLDLFLDYILKIHHRGIRTEGPAVVQLFRAALAESPADEQLAQAFLLFQYSLADLEMHLMKEENVLFPFLLELFEAEQQAQPIEQMHCGSVANPIHVMHMEHDGEIQRYARIAKLTNDFAVASDASAARAALMPRLKAFMEALHEHIALENDHLFVRAVQLEQAWVR